MNATPQTLKAVATGQQTAQEARDPYSVFKSQLERVKGELLPLLGTPKNVDAFVRVVLTAVSNNQDLLSADRRSLLTACTKAAQDGLMPDGNQAVLNIRNTKVRRSGREEWINMVVYEPMVAGYIKNMYEHPDVEMVDAAAVFANDQFKFVRGDNPRLEHEPNLTDDPGPIVAAYLVVRLKNGQIKREVMPRRDIEKVKAVSKSKDGPNSPWNKWEDQMAIKSVIKRGAKQLPRSNKFEQMDRHDNEADAYAAADTTGAAMFTGQGAAPALEHNPSEVLEPTMHAGEQSLEHVEQVQEGASQPARARRREAAPDSKAGLYATLMERLNAAKTREEAAPILEEGTALPQDQYAGLEQLFAEKFPAA